MIFEIFYDEFCALNLCVIIGMLNLMELIFLCA